jgi:hypothetical protein
MRTGILAVRVHSLAVKNFLSLLHSFMMQVLAGKKKGFTIFFLKDSSSRFFWEIRFKLLLAFASAEI